MTDVDNFFMFLMNMLKRTMEIIQEMISQI